MEVESDLTLPSNWKDQLACMLEESCPHQHTWSTLIQIPKTLNLRSEGRIQDPGERAYQDRTQGSQGGFLPALRSGGPQSPSVNCPWDSWVLHNSHLYLQTLQLVFASPSSHSGPQLKINTKAQVCRGRDCGSWVMVISLPQGSGVSRCRKFKVQDGGCDGRSSRFGG